MERSKIQLILHQNDKAEALPVSSGGFRFFFLDFTLFCPGRIILIRTVEEPGRDRSVRHKPVFCLELKQGRLRLGIIYPGRAAAAAIKIEQILNLQNPYPLSKPEPSAVRLLSPDC